MIADPTSATESPEPVTSSLPSTASPVLTTASRKDHYTFISYADIANSGNLTLNQFYDYTTRNF